MTDNKEYFEATKNGIKISYLRFLSDSASGYIAILISLYLYYCKIGDAYISDICYDMFHISFLHTDVSTEVKMFVLILLFLLATPLGLFINASSWALLGKLQIWSEKFWFSSNFWLIKGTKEKFLFKNSKEYFKFDKDNFYSKSKFIEENLRIDYPDLLRYLDHVEGVKNFSRSAVLLLFIVFFLHFVILSHYLVNPNLNPEIIEIIYIRLGIILLFSLLIIVILSIVTFYYDSYIAFMGYLLYESKKNHNYDILNEISKIILYENGLKK